MTKPHEETWSANAKGAAMICNEDGHGQGVFMFDKDDRERARLAAQAPAMARLLLEGQWICEERGDLCRHCGKLEREGHADDCELVTVLRAAGVLP